MQFMFVFVFQISTSAQAKSRTVTEMRYVRTLKGLSPAHVNLVPTEIVRSAEVMHQSIPAAPSALPG